jgi:hypothetical protein
MSLLDTLSPITGLFEGKDSSPSVYGQSSPEPVEGDSLTKAARSITNYQAPTGMKTFGQGQQDTQSGLSDLHPALDYFRRLLSGDREALASATQPQTDQIAGQFQQIRQMFSNNGSRGGGQTSTLAQMPFTQQRELADLNAQARNNAAGTIGQLGLGESGIGLGEEAQGAGLLSSANQALLARRGQDFQVDMNNRDNLTRGLTAVAGPALGDAAEVGLGKIAFPGILQGLI